MKPWTATKAFKKWKTAVNHNKTLKKVKNPADMCLKSSFCKGAKDIPRKLMPQIYDAKKFAKTIKRKFGVKSRRAMLKPRNLKPAQNEINGEIVDSIIKTKKSHNNPLVVSQDNYIVDGHHRWAAAKKTKPNKAVPVLIIKKPIHDALGVAVATETKREKF
jgi:hypothetical protein